MVGPKVWEEGTLDGWGGGVCVRSGLAAKRR